MFSFTRNRENVTPKFHGGFCFSNRAGHGVGAFCILMSEKTRLDVALVERGLVESREKARRLIMAGQVRIRDTVAAKPGQTVSLEDGLYVIAGEKFVSRGGGKLEAALEAFGISCEKRICLDLGASTGGFCDCLLQRGAGCVYAVDVGENQIAWKLRSDPRVRVLDRTNARHLNPSLLDAPPDLVTADVSFISLTKVLPAAARCAAGNADFVVLIKPQFEAGREFVGRGGVVRDPAVHRAVIDQIQTFVENSLNGIWRDVIQSPVTGPAGNKEFLAWFQMKMKNHPTA